MEIEKRKLISLGAGKGILEWHLKNSMPNLIIECTDYTPEAIEQLKRVFRKLDAAYQFDMLNGNYCALDINAIFLMHRVSTEFALKEWYEILKKCIMREYQISFLSRQDWTRYVI